MISFTLLSLVIDFTFYNEEEKIIYALIYYFFGSLLYCLYDILRKKYFNLYYHSPYIIMLFIGFFGSIILIIYDMIMNYYYLENKHFIIIKSFHENVTLSNCYLFILDLLCHYLWNLGIWLTIYYFSPCHFIISELISEYTSYIINAFNYNEKENNDNYLFINIILYSICCVINIISGLIFNEIIIINIKQLSKYTKKKILERERIDTYITYKQLDNTSRKNSMKSSDQNEQNDQNDLSSNLIKFDRLEEINIKEQINKVYK